jgi:hypothetical protein
MGPLRRLMPLVLLPLVVLLGVLLVLAEVL